jgi:FHS family glucose/mannose:H+ symporter-like MFS transporter
MFKRLGRTYSRYAFLCFGAFFVYALYFNIFGTNAAQMKAYFGTNSVEQGLIISVQAAGGIAVSIFLTLFGERFNKLKAIWRGLFILAAASAAIGLIPLAAGSGGGYGAALLFACAAGCGFTLVDIMMNASIPEVFAAERDNVFPLVHASYSVGSMVSPVMTSMLIAAAAPQTYALPFLACGALCFAEWALFRPAALKIMPDTPYARMPAPKKIARADFAVLKRGGLWLFFLSGVFYFSFQITVSAWFPSYAVRDLGLTNAMGGLGVTLFFGMSLIARITAPLIYRIMGVRRYYIVFGALGGLFTWPVTRWAACPPSLPPWLSADIARALCRPRSSAFAAGLFRKTRRRLPPPSSFQSTSPRLPGPRLRARSPLAPDTRRPCSSAPSGFSWRH